MANCSGMLWFSSLSLTLLQNSHGTCLETCWSTANNSRLLETPWLPLFHLASMKIAGNQYCSIGTKGALIQRGEFETGGPSSGLPPKMRANVCELSGWSPEKYLVSPGLKSNRAGEPDFSRKG